MTQRPELYAAVVCSYPLLDMVRYQKFLVAGYWVPEYGSGDNPEQFPFIYAYSPYHHVKAGTKYPAVLLVTGDSDTRVAPLHARKMTALDMVRTGERFYTSLGFHKHGAYILQNADMPGFSAGEQGRVALLVYGCRGRLEKIAQKEGTLHVCGELCAQKLQSQFMGNVRENIVRRGV